MQVRILHGKVIVGGYAEGEALVTSQSISGWGGVDPATGTIIESKHELRGQSFKDKVLVFPGAKGSSGWSSIFHTARLAGAAPKSMIFQNVNTKVVLGAIVAHVPSMTAFDEDPIAVIETGDWVKVNADAGIVEVIKREV